MGRPRMAAVEPCLGNQQVRSIEVAFRASGWKRRQMPGKGYFDLSSEGVGRLGASRVAAAAVGSPEILKRREINGDQTAVQEQGYAIT